MGRRATLDAPAILFAFGCLTDLTSFLRAGAANDRRWRRVLEKHAVRRAPIGFPLRVLYTEREPGIVAAGRARGLASTLTISAVYGWRRWPPITVAAHTALAGRSCRCFSGTATTSTLICSKLESPPLRGGGTAAYVCAISRSDGDRLGTRFRRRSSSQASIRRASLRQMSSVLR